jgi:hypothetical protein
MLLFGEMRESLLKPRPLAQQRACVGTMKYLMGAIETYNLAHPDQKVIQWQEELEEVLIREKALAHKPQRPTASCTYSSVGNLSTASSTLSCSEHGLAWNPLEP